MLYLFSSILQQKRGKEVGAKDKKEVKKKDRILKYDLNKVSTVLSHSPSRPQGYEPEGGRVGIGEGIIGVE